MARGVLHAAALSVGVCAVLWVGGAHAVCLGPLGPGLQIFPNSSPTPVQIDAISDAVIVANMASDFALLLQGQPGTYQLFAAFDASCPTNSPAYEFAQQVAGQLTPSLTANLNTLAVAVTASAVANITSFGFNSTINTAALASTMQQVATQNFANQVATAIYNVRFQRAVGPDNTYMFGVMNNQAAIQAYQQYVSAQPYINQLVTEVQTGQPNAYHNAALVTYKLDQLSSGSYQAVSALYQQYSLPVYSGVWTDLFSAQQLSGNFLNAQVMSLVNQTTVQNHPMSVGYGNFVNTQTTTYGAAVQAFVNGPAAQQGLASGQQPSNVSTCQGMGVAGC